MSATKHLVKANILATEEILKIQPNAKFVQSESSEYYHPLGPQALQEATRLNQLRFLALDLNYGVDVCGTMYEYLMGHGLTRDEYHFFIDRNVRAVCIMGNDYYATNEHIVYPDGSSHICEIFGYYVITKQYYDRYRLPVMHTQTNNRDVGKAEKDARSWLERQWANLLKLKEDGVPIVGFTWFSLTDQLDWDSLLTEDNGHVNRFGLVDLDRKIRPVGEAYRDLISTWQDQISVGLLCLK